MKSRADSGVFVAYCRKSTDDDQRQVLSLETQTDEVRRLENSRSVHAAEILSEARSARTPGRPVFNAMMKRVYRGEIRGILTWKLDRLARNPIDGGKVIWAMKEYGLTIITPTQTFSHASDNIFLMYIEFGMAHKYVDDLARSVTAGLEKKADMGWRPSRAPLGYRNNSFKKQGERDVSRDPERFELVRSMWDLMLTGAYSVQQIQQIVNETWGLRTRPGKFGGKPLARSVIYNIFSNSFYYGFYEYPVGSGTWHRGAHEPMVTVEEFDRVQLLLGRKGRPRPQKNAFSLTGLIRCGECGQMVTAEKKEHVVCSSCRAKFSSLNKDQCPRCSISIATMEAPVRRRYVYYHCTGRTARRCSQKVVTDKALEAQILELLGRIDMPKSSAALAFEELDDVAAKERRIGKIAGESVNRAKAEINKRLDRLVDLQTSPQNSDGSLLSDQEYGQRRKLLLLEKAKLDNRLSERERGCDRDIEKVRATLEIATEVRERFRSGDHIAQKRILTDVGSNLTLTNKILSMQARIPFKIVPTFFSESDDDPDAIEPSKESLNASYSIVSPFVSLVWCSRQESNLYYQLRKLASYPLNDESNV